MKSSFTISDISTTNTNIGQRNDTSISSNSQMPYSSRDLRTSYQLQVQPEKASDLLYNPRNELRSTYNAKSPFR
jgi:hypothetical protein